MGGGNGHFSPTEQRMASQFDDLAELYEEFSAMPFRQRLEFPTVLGLVAETASPRVLDLGCGSGVYSRLLRARGVPHVTGLDASQGMIDYARRREQREQLGIRYLAGAALPLHLHGTFDLVLAVYVLPYATAYEELVGLCRTAADALRPGGRFLTLPMNPDFPPDPEYYARYHFWIRAEAGREDAAPVRLNLRLGEREVSLTARYWTCATLLRALAEAGFRNPRRRVHRCPEETTAQQRDFWTPYVSAPHAVILDTVKEDGTP
jgi:SAM-dependent methyltransferase